MRTNGRLNASFEHGHAEVGRGTDAELRTANMPVREFLAEGARRGLTTDRMFPSQGTCATAVPGRDACPTSRGD